MQFPLVLAILSGVLYAVAAVGYKMAERLNCRTSTFIVVFSIAGGVFAIIKSFSETSEWKNPPLWLLGIAMGILFDLAIFFILQSNKNGPASISWTILNLSLLVPVILSPMLFQERVYWIDPIIVAAFVLMLAFFAQSLRKADNSDKKKTVRYFLLLLGIFLSQGLFTMFALYELNRVGTVQSWIIGLPKPRSRGGPCPSQLYAYLSNCASIWRSFVRASVNASGSTL